jgi:uncharacterized membrane protein
MRNYNSTSVSTRSDSISCLLESFAAASFVAALFTDLVYWRAPDAMWETFSVWLITAGLVMAGVSALSGVIGLARRHRRARSRLQLLVIAVAYFLAFINAFVHSRDGYTAVVPTGLLLSILVVILLGLAGWVRPATLYRFRESVVN